MMTRMFQQAGFTLMEVNLAIFIMAVGVLSMCSLYTLGYRENRQSVEDVAGAAFADAYLSPLITGLSATNMTWTAWTQIGQAASGTAQERGVADAVWPSDGWAAYVKTFKNRNNEVTYRVAGSPRSTADGVFGNVSGKVPSEYCAGNPSIDGDYQYGLVVTRRGAVIQLAFRIARRKETLMTQPIFVSEVHFQGDPNE